MDFGLKVRDKITGFEGVITGKSSYITGCDQYLIQPPAKDGSFVTGTWIDEGRIEVVDQQIDPSDVQSEKNGCDIPAPIK